MDMMLVFDVVLCVYGVHMVYCAFQMKQTGMASNWIVHEKIIATLDNAKFVQKMFLPTVIMGVITILYGVSCLMNDYVIPLQIVPKLMLGLFLICVAGYIILLNRARKLKK